MYSKQIVRYVSQLKVNRLIKCLILADFFIWSSQQLFYPIFAIFLTEKIHGASVEVVGISTSIYMIVRAVLELPVGMWLDRTKVETDDLYSAFIGTLMIAAVYFV